MKKSECPYLDHKCNTHAQCVKCTGRLTNLERCSFLQRKIILHSIIYYELNDNILSDQEFDRMCRKLLKGIQYTKDYQRSDYFYVFYDFDGSTGFHLYGRLEEDDKQYLMHLAQAILAMAKRERT